ncbi:serpin family protein [Pseudofrankia inefficax]|uniref:Proteinase inhibitor I4 serpin n=1 Tax=Pseudofrankia inefficax (strain DSM 45817 / CECT 9037 / DDB 130130 / EuI1c) TaxID=298654 RepID=E3IWZ9_PSEI1|nr:serpin family protein [Pseudofrankia inefficax]ADP82623.1 proteinase inhibitor I4 serpin [Pseudofrankia inefficax]
MLARREFLRGAVLAAAGLGVGTLATGCGSNGSPSGTVATAGDRSRAAADGADLPGAAAAVSAFSAELYRRLSAAATGNLICSPYSAVMALAMARAGAVGRTATELDTVLHAPTAGGGDPLGPGLNALALTLDARAGARKDMHGAKATITLDVANALWGQDGEKWEAPFLTTLARHYGAGMRLVDYRADSAGAAKAINAWTSQQTKGRIPKIVDGLDPSTRLVLANALYLRAPWNSPFGDAQPAPFTRLDGSVVQAQLMSVDAYDAGYATGPDWQAVDVPYAGGELAMAVILPDQGRFEAVRAALDGTALRRLLTGLQVTGVQLDLPKWTTRTRVRLDDALVALGMPTAFGDSADFSGMTTTERLSIASVPQEAFVAVDEHGTEAAAATAVVMGVSAIVAPRRKLTVDRPYLYVIHDRPTGTPLFLGHVTDPTAV